MPIYEHKAEFAGHSLQDWDADQGISEPETTGWRISVQYDEADEGITWAEKLGQFLEDPQAAEVRVLVVGSWDDISEGGSADEVVEALVNAAERLPKLRALFFGDVTAEECEVSWIEQTDLSPLFAAYPQLEHFGVRGGNNLTLGTIEHSKLRSLIIETGGLGSDVVEEIAGSTLPALEHLELWLGDEDYGGDVTPEHLEPILSGHLFPKLQYLGLRDSEVADEIAAAVAKAPILEQLQVLDLSMGTLGDQGAAALAESPGVRGLKKLVLDHHYISDDMLARLRTLGPEIQAELQLEAETYGDDDEQHRYVALGE